MIEEAKQKENTNEIEPTSINPAINTNNINNSDETSTYIFNT